MRVAITFPGQGTQAPGMGAPWLDSNSWKILEHAAEALNEDLAELVLHADADALARTRSAQLAVLLTSLMAWDAAEATIRRNHQIVAFAGHSLGQVTALIASGAVSLIDGVRFAARRAELTQAEADRNEGRMAALLGVTPEQATLACDAAPNSAWVANDNAPGQVVIAGTATGIETAIARAKELGAKRAMHLPVDGAFHTPLMGGAVAGLAEALTLISFAEPSAPVVSNADARAYSDGIGWQKRLATHPVSAVRWRECMLSLCSRPLNAEIFFEIGHGAMIAGVAKRTVDTVRVVSVAGQSDIEAIE